MKIKSILNNNALISIDNRGKEIILVGNGISFGKHSGDLVDESKIENLFMKSSQSANDLMEVIATVPEKYFEVSNVIIRYLTKKLGRDVKKSIYFTLPDHVNVVLIRYKEGIQLNFGMLSDLKELYPKIYSISEWAFDYLNAAFEVNLNRDEIGFLAMHFLNSLNDDMETKNAKKIMKLVHQIIDLIGTNYNDIFSLEGTNFFRFLAHLKYLAIRYINHEQFKKDNSFSISIPDSKNQKINNCIEDINNLLKAKYGNELSVDEKNYLRLHLFRQLKK